MAKANLVQKKVQMSHRDIIKYQLINHCFIYNIHFSDNELDCLVLLGAYGTHDFTDFCSVTVQEKIFKTPQTVRNFLTKACKKGIAVKEGTGKKTIKLDPEIQIQSQGNIILDYKMIHVTQEQ